MMKFIDAIRRIVSRNPIVSNEFIITQLCEWFPELKNKERCPNCDGSMQSYIFKFDVLDALLLISMSKVVSENLDKSINFTEANKIHIQSMDNTSYAIRSRTSQCRQLGLVAKVLNVKGTHEQGTWCITRRGWDALRGREVPAEVHSFQNKIIKRSEKVTTISHALRSHTDRVFDQRLAGKLPKADHVEEIKELQKFDWVHLGEKVQGSLLQIDSE